MKMPGGIHQTFRSALAVFIINLLSIFTSEGALQLQRRAGSWLTWCVGLTILQDLWAWVKSSRNLSRLQHCFGFGKSAWNLVCLKDPWTQITIWTELDSNKFSGPLQQSSSGFPSGFCRVFLRTNDLRYLSDMAQRQRPMPENIAK